MVVYRDEHKIANLYLPKLVGTLNFGLHSFTNILDNKFVSMLLYLDIVNTTSGLNKT